MKNVNFKLTAISVALVAVITSGCSSSGDGSSTTEDSFTYSTTSSKGDYSEWTIVGSSLTATWNVVADNGDIEYSYDVTATCGDAADSGVRSCSIDTGSCTDGTAVCTDTPTGDFDMMDVPGVALFIHTDGEFDDEQLHVGFAKNDDACTDDVSGDYTFMRTGLGLDENFGMYRSDDNFVDILHSDFGFNSAIATATPDVVYRTGTENEVLADQGCVDGVRTRSIGGGESIRSMMTNSGLFVLGFPAGQGGIVSFKTSNAASLDDFANKSFGGIVFPDDSGPEPISATSGVLTGGEVTIAATIDGVVENLSIMQLDTADSMTNPAYPDFTAVPATYDASTLSMTYATPNDIPGLFKFDNLTDGGRVIMAAMKFNDKVIGIGMVYNHRDAGDTNPANGNPFPDPNLYNTGNFILFEK
ncbi:hypothetical protein MNBD_GAMMA05-2358 [hydrothermal vent metagenome]|uniref:Uncharacterized protein n=1 Tax=hydrothermal vent metagenome TaxID=652676 RepID=A0A3B0W6S6_9ZZZZ